MSLDSKLASSTFPSSDASICLDAELLERYANAKALVVALMAQRDESAERGGQRVPVGKAQRELDVLRQKVQDATITLRVFGMPFHDYQRILRDNPGKNGESYDPTTFWLALAKHTAKYVESDGSLSDITPEQWARLEGALTDGQHDAIAAAAYEVNKNKGVNTGFLGRASGKTRG